MNNKYLFIIILLLMMPICSSASTVTSNIDIDSGWQTIISNNYSSGVGTNPHNIFIAPNDEISAAANITFDGDHIISTNQYQIGDAYIGQLYPATHTRFRVKLNITTTASNPGIYFGNGYLFKVSIFKVPKSSDEDAYYQCYGYENGTQSYTSFNMPDFGYADIKMDYDGTTQTLTVWSTDNPSLKISCHNTTNVATPYILPTCNLFDCPFSGCGSGTTFNIMNFEQSIPKKLITIQPDNNKFAYGFDGPRSNFTAGANWLVAHGYRATIWLDPFYLNDPAIESQCKDLIFNKSWEVDAHFSKSLSSLSMANAINVMDSQTAIINSTFGPVLSWCSLGNSENASHVAYMYSNYGAIHRNSPVSNSDGIYGADTILSSSTVSTKSSIPFWNAASSHGSFKPVYAHSIITPLQEADSTDYNDFVRIMTNYSNSGIIIIPFAEWYYETTNTNQTIDNIYFSPQSSYFNFNSRGYPTNLTIYDPNGAGIWFEGSDVITHVDGTGNNILTVNTSTTKTIQKLNASIITADSLYVTPVLWNITGDYHKEWTEYSNNHSVISTHIIGDFPANRNINISIDGVYYTTLSSNKTGYINWVYSGGSSTHLFDATLSATQPTILSWILVICFIVLLIIFLVPLQKIQKNM